MSSPELALHDGRFARTRSLLRHSSFQNRNILKRQQSCSEKLRSQPQSSHHRSSQSVPECTTRKDQMRGKLTGKQKAKKRSSTLLHAVPGSAGGVTDPLSLERDMATLPNQEILESISSPSRICADGEAPFQIDADSNYPRQLATSNISSLSPILAGVEMSFPELKGTIGTYTDGRIQWEQKNYTSKPASRSSICSSKSQRPKIQVVIPIEQRNRPLPSLPFFGQGVPTSNQHQVTSSSAEFCSVSSASAGTQASAQRSAVSPSLPHRHPSKAVLEIVRESVTPPLCSSSDDSHEDDRSSIYSRRSSMTSAEGEAGNVQQREKLDFHARSASAAFSIVAPSKAGVFNDRQTAPQHQVETETGSRAFYPQYSPPRRYAPHPPLDQDVEFQRSCDIGPTRSGTLSRRPSVRRKISGQSASRRISMLGNPTIGVINEAISRSTSNQFASKDDSPTLSEAENELEQHLASSSNGESFEGAEFRSNEAPESSPPPALPRKSSKRPARGNVRLSQVPGNHIPSQIKRQQSKHVEQSLKLEIPGKEEPATEDMGSSPTPLPPPKAVKRSITPASAENVIHGILQNLQTLDDLFAFAVVNKGFYRVFKRHELDLVRAALRKSSPPAWEHREICYPGHDKPEEEALDQPRREYTPTSYLQYYTRDMYIIAALKSLIKDKCQSFVRPEVSAALVSEEPADFARVDDALWRIWTFCKIFGCGKGREDDVVAQMDWLKGGELANQTECTFNIATFDMSDALASAPECFAQGNEGGLTAEQLFDMMELWNCLGVLLQPFEGRTIQAREHGVYENTDVRGGDIDGEEALLDEWCYFLLTLGLSPVLDLATPCRQKDTSAFLLASQNGWMNWKPPVFGGSRRNFLKEAASRLYEEKITTTFADSSHKEVQRALSKQRIQRHITELRHRRHKSPDTIPEIRMSNDRPMSEWEDVMDRLTRPRPATGNDVVSYIPGIRSDAPRSPLSQHVFAAGPESGDVHPALRNRTGPPPIRPNSRVVAQPLLPSPPPSTVPSVAGDRRSSIAPSMPSINEHPAFRSHSPVPEVPLLQDHPMFRNHPGHAGSTSSLHIPGSSRTGSDPVYEQHQVQQAILHSDPSENSAEKAVYQIVEMGFTAHQARIALRMTDLGDGLRVDRAVELLLREHETL